MPRGRDEVVGVEQQEAVEPLVGGQPPGADEGARGPRRTPRPSPVLPRRRAGRRSSPAPWSPPARASTRGSLQSGVLVLLPPSEGKTPPHARGPRLDLDQPCSPGLTPLREKVLDALVEVSARDPTRCDVLGVGASLADEVARNVHLRTGTDGPRQAGLHRRAVRGGRPGPADADGPRTCRGERADRLGAVGARRARRRGSRPTGCRWARTCRASARSRRAWRGALGAELEARADGRAGRRLPLGRLPSRRGPAGVGRLGVGAGAARARRACGPSSRTTPSTPAVC